MTEDQPLPTPGAQTSSAPEAEPAKATTTKRTSSDGARYAVYDTDELRFVGPVHDSKPAAKDAKQLVPEGHSYEVREV